MTEAVFNAEAIAKAVLELKSQESAQDNLIIIMPAAWRPLVEEKPKWLEGVEVKFDDEIYLA